MIEVRHDPSRREVRVFGALWLLFFCALGAVAVWRPGGLVGAAGLLGTAWAISLVLNPARRTQQALGLMLPLLFVVVGGSVRWGAPAVGIAATCAAAGIAGAMLVWAAPGLGRRLYVGWMLAAAPIGWTLSHLVLAVVYYGVLTPIGLVMRLAGRDPMHRRFDREASSYWVERRGGDDPSRYFRQF